MKRTHRHVLLLLAVLLILFEVASPTRASGELPYTSYNYDYRGNIVFTPAPYVPNSSISGDDLVYEGESIGAFVNPQDICISEHRQVYIADTGNNRIVVLNETLDEVVQIIDSFELDGNIETFNQPYGVCVSANEKLYIADTYNKRIVILELDGTYIGMVKDPKSEILEEGFDYAPLKVTVDYADRIYCVAKNMFEGIMVFDQEGNFIGFFGTIDVKISLWDKFWRKIATKEERKNQQLFIPTEFTGIDVDASGFIYASSLDSEGVQAVRRLNPNGQDVIKKGVNQNVGGDLMIHGASDYAGPSEIIDVVYRDNGMYSLLDRKRGRIFTYDGEGNLLYIFGGLGTQVGTFSAPVAIEELNNQIIVLDSLNAEMLIFDSTDYGSLINEAIAFRYDGDEKEAIVKWQEVLKLDENNELANTGIGKAYLTAGDNLKAMYYLKLGMNRKYYSIAFKRYRNDLLENNLGFVLSIIVFLILASNIYKRIKKNKHNIENEGGLL